MVSDVVSVEKMRKAAFSRRKEACRFRSFGFHVCGDRCSQTAARVRASSTDQDSSGLEAGGATSG